MAVASVFCSMAATSSYDANKPVGWGTKGTTITGGEGGTCVTVTSASDLEKYLKASGKYTIYVKGAITVSSMISVQVTNKSLYGLPGSYLYNPNRTASGSGILYFKSGSDNIIMRNMTFKSAGAYDVDGNDNFCIDKTTNIWVDHCDFQDGVDGNFDCKNASDYVCVTWCKFHYLIAPKAGGSGGADDHRYTDLWGSSDSKTTDSGHLNTTFMYCWWGDGCVERMPRVRFGKVHIINCLYNSSASNYCIGAGNNSSIYVEKTAFIGVQDPYKDYSSSSAKGYLTFDDCLFSNCKTQNGNMKGTGGAFTPSSYYSLTGIDASKVESVVSDASCGAGATLTVVECQGVVTSTPTDPSGSSSSSSSTTTTTTATLTKTGVGSSSQEVTVGTAITDFGYTWTEATNATVTGLPNGVNATIDANNKTISISGTPTTAGTYKFTVATTGATTNATKTGTITVNAASSSDSGSGSSSSSSDNTGSTTTEGSDMDNTTFSDTIYCSPNGTGDGKTINTPTDVLSAIKNVPAGGVIFLLEGTYSFTSTINIEESNSGSAGKMKTIAAYKNAKVVFDFSGMAVDGANRGFVLQGSYWHFYGFEITKAGDNGMLLAGDHNLIEKMVFSKNQDTGLQISRYNSNYSAIADWPSYNTILNCTARNNCDDATMENADGFAAKLTCGEGNVFDGCMSYNNSDDGWDLFAKEETGPIGIVTLKNCIAFRNGYTEDGKGYGDCDGNGFKLGGSGVGSAHVVYNCLAFENLHCGFTDNNNPKLGSLTNCTAVNNDIKSSGKPNFSVYRCTAGVFTNLMSFFDESSIKPSNDKYVGTYENGVYYNSGYYLVDDKTSVTSGQKIGTKLTTAPSDNDFLSTTVAAMNTVDFHTTWRNADGSLNPGGYMETKAGDYCSMGYHMVNLDCTASDAPVTPSTDDSGDTGGSTDIDVTDSEMICYFTGLTPSSKSFYSVTGNYSSSKGSATVNGTTYSDCLKLESSTSVSFTAAKTAKLVVVFAEGETASLKINGTSVSSMSNATINGNVLTVSPLNAGTYTLTKDQSVNIFYIATSYESQSGIENVASDANILSGPVYDTMGRMVNINQLQENKVYICNGKKFIYRNK